MQPSAPSCLNRDNIGLIAKFRPKNSLDDNIVCVATTHLLFNPRRDDVRLAQTALLLAGKLTSSLFSKMMDLQLVNISELDRFTWTGEQGNPYLPIILTGDFNCTADSNVISLLTRGFCSCPQFLPADLGISNHCQHVNVVNSRSLGRDAAQVLNERLFHSTRNNELENGRFDSQRMPASVRHKFGFKSVYNPYQWPRQVRHILHYLSWWLHFIFIAPFTLGNDQAEQIHHGGLCVLLYVLFKVPAKIHWKQLEIARSCQFVYWKGVHRIGRFAQWNLSFWSSEFSSSIFAYCQKEIQLTLSNCLLILVED